MLSQVTLMVKAALCKKKQEQKEFYISNKRNQIKSYLILFEIKQYKAFYLSSSFNYINDTWMILIWKIPLSKIVFFKENYNARFRTPTFFYHLYKQANWFLTLTMVQTGHSHQGQKDYNKNQTFNELFE